MIQGKIEWLCRLDNFYKNLIKQAVDGKISEKDFLMILGAKCKAEERELRGRKEIKVEYTD